MADFPTFEDLFRVGRDEALIRNSRLSREVIEREGSDANVIVAASAAVGDELVAQITRVAKGLFLDTARGECLDRLIFDRFNLKRKDASAALVSVRFTTSAPNPGAFSIPAGTKLGTADGVQFVTTVDAPFPVGSVGPITVAARSAQAGADQQVGIGTITSILGAIPGAPADLAVTNHVASSGAADREEDDDYIARARLVFDTARRGTLDAIRARALAVPGVQNATAFEVLDSLGRPARTTQLVISDVFTQSLVSTSPTPATYQTQSQLLASAVFAALSDTRSGGIYVHVIVAIVALQGVQLGLRFQANIDVDAAAFRARAAIASHINSLAPGDPLLITDMIDVLRRVPGLVVTGDEVLSPPGDVIAEPLQVLRTSIGMVVATSVQPDVALLGSANPDATI